jgi:hypothetical protein
LGGAFTGGPYNPVQAFSSAGPRRMFFQADGTAITPGNFLFSTSGGILLNKPNLAAADGVTTKSILPITWRGSFASAAFSVSASLDRAR